MYMTAAKTVHKVAVIELMTKQQLLTETMSFPSLEALSYTEMYTNSAGDPCGQHTAEGRYKRLVVAFNEYSVTHTGIMSKD